MAENSGHGGPPFLHQPSLVTQVGEVCGERGREGVTREEGGGWKEREREREREREGGREGGRGGGREGGGEGGREGGGREGGGEGGRENVEGEG